MKAGREAQVDGGPLVEDLREQVLYLRSILDEEREARRRADMIIAQLTQANAALAAKVPELEAPQEAQGAPESVVEEPERAEPRSPVPRAHRRAHSALLIRPSGRCAADPLLVRGGGGCSVADDRESLHREAIIELHKMEFDIHRTLATLVTGSLVAVIAQSNILVPDAPRFLLVLGASCVLLLFSMGWAMAAMIRLMTEVMMRLSPYNTRTNEAEAESSRGLRRSRWLSLVSLPLGIGVFALYVWLNAFV